MTTDRKQLLHAYGIVEYQRVVEQMELLRSQGVSVPFSILGRVQTERDRLIRRWLWDHGDPKFSRDLVPDVVGQVRAWLAEHVTELDELLEKEGIV